MRRKFKSTKISELIGDFLESAKNGEVHSIKNLNDLWESVLGKQVALETKSITLKDKTLHVTVNNPYLKTDLITQKHLIINKMNALNKDIIRIVFD